MPKPPRPYTDRVASREAARGLPIEQRRANRAAARSEANVARARIRQQLNLPPLHGAKADAATAIREERITEALSYIAPMRDGTVRYSLTASTLDPLYTSEIPDLRPWETGDEYDTEEALLAAVITTLTTTAPAAQGGDRTSASWWLHH